jgi:hypothetical protein
MASTRNKMDKTTSGAKRPNHRIQLGCASRKLAFGNCAV